MQIKYSPTREISTSDLFIATDPPIIFEVKARLSPEWARLLQSWEQDGSNDIEIATELMGQAFVSVSQNNEKWPLNSKEYAQELLAAIEESNPDAGGEFVCEVVSAFAFNHYNFLAKNSMASGALSRRSGGNKSKNNRA